MPNFIEQKNEIIERLIQITSSALELNEFSMERTEAVLVERNTLLDRLAVIGHPICEEDPRWLKQLELLQKLDHSLSEKIKANIIQMQRELRKEANSKRSLLTDDLIDPKGIYFTGKA